MDYIFPLAINWRRYEISCSIKYFSAREEKFRTSKAVNILTSFLCLYYSADLGVFFLFLFVLFIYLSFNNIDSFLLSMSGELFWKIAFERQKRKLRYYDVISMV